MQSVISTDFVPSVFIQIYPRGYHEMCFKYFTLKLPLTRHLFSLSSMNSLWLWIMRSWTKRDEPSGKCVRHTHTYTHTCSDVLRKTQAPSEQTTPEKTCQKPASHYAWQDLNVQQVFPESLPYQTNAFDTFFKHLTPVVTLLDTPTPSFLFWYILFFKY